MVFKSSEIENFKAIFNSVKPKIQSMPGCLNVQLKQDSQRPELFFTVSEWENESFLELYRQSDLFITTWKAVKPLFKEKAEAWSLN